MADDTSTVVVEFRDAGATAGLRSVRQAIQETGDATTVAGNAMPKFYEGVEQAGLKAGGAERGMRRLEYGLTAVATESLGAESGLLGAASRAVEAGLLFGYGSEGVLAIAAGIGAFGITLKAIQAPLEAVTKDAAGLTKEFDKVTAAVHPGVAAMNEVLAVAHQVQQAQEDAEPTFWQQLLGSPLLGLDPTGAVQDQIDAQHTLEQSAEATAKSLRPVLDQLVAIGQTKELIRNVAAEMDHLTAVGGAVTRTQTVTPAPTLLDSVVAGLGGTVPGPHQETTVTGTGLIGAQATAVAKARGMGWSKELTDATVEAIDKDFVGRVGKALKDAGDNLTAIPVLQGMAHDAAGAVRRSGVADNIADALIAQIRADLLSAIETMQKAEGPSALSPTARARAFGAGVGLVRFQAPTPQPLFGEQAPPDLLRSPNLAAALAGGAPGALSSLTDVKAREDGARAFAEFVKQLDAASKHTEKFDASLVGAIGAFIASAGSGTPQGILGGAGGLLSTLSADPKLGLASLSLPGAILGTLGGLLGVFDSGPKKVVVSAYDQTALQQMKALTDQLGTLVSVIVTNGQGQPLDNVAYGLNRLTRRDALPRFPRGVGGS